MACPERHFRVDDDVVGALGDVFMERAVDDASVRDNNRLEIMFLPFAVPVLSFDFGGRGRGDGIPERVFFQDFRKSRGGIE